MRAKIKRWLIGAVLLVGAGLTVRQAIIQSAATEGLTCADAQTIVTFLENRNSPYLIPFADKIVPDTCSVTYTPRCSRLPDGTFCRGGLRHGVGHGGVINCPATEETMKSGAKCDIDSCNVGDGQPIPCSSIDGMFGSGQYDPDTIDTKNLLRAIRRKFADEGLADTLPEE